MTARAPLPAGLDAATAAAIRAAQEEVDAAPSSGAAWRKLGMTWHANGHPVEALACYRESQRLAPEDARAWHLAGVAAEQLGDLEAAKQAFTRSGQLSPAMAAPAWRLGLLLVDTGQLAAAEAAFRRAVSVDPGDPHGHLGLARIALATERPSDAIDALAPVLASDSSNRHARHLLGSALRQLGHWEEARLEFLRAGARRSEWSDAWTAEMRRHRAGFSASAEMGLAALEAGDFATALAVFSELNRARPDTAHVLTNLSLALESLGRVMEAAALIEAAALRQPASASLRIDLARIRLRQDRPEDALREASSALVIDPSSTQAHLLRAVALDATGHPREADAALAEARRLGSRPDDLLVAAGKLELQLGLVDAAQARFEQALAADDDAADAGLGLAIIAMQRGDRARVQAALEAAMLAGAAPASVKAVHDEVQRRDEAGWSKQ